MEGLIFSIKRYAIHDGPGIRVTLFMKGCPLDCWWCHNPEGKSACISIVGRVDRVGDREFRSEENVGKYYTAGEIMAMVERDRVFMDHSAGGVTFSGGEPLMQPAFLLEALIMLKNGGFHTAVDTSGYAAPETLKSIMPFTDLFLYDVKHIDPEIHEKYTGVSNELIISNLDMLLESGTDVMLRIPVIPGLTADSEYMQRLAQFIGSRNNGNIKEINLLPYHKTGSSKYRRFEMPDRMASFSQVSNGHLDNYIEIFKPLGIHVKKGG
ncbi:MAG: glycyl-radical enzyme activating protein [Bacteroidales bacterium]|jgi:pyruvate formate lyase activating enzyme|nr:glycyl-radical enzyme activating protein [Bacteroidales bacterium]